MKAISLLQPWASLIGIKGNETRSWYTKYRGRLAIHASKNPKMVKELAWSEPFYSALINKVPFGEMPYGAVVSISNMVECCLIKADGLHKVPNGQSFSGPESCTEFYAPLPGEPELSFGDYTPGRYAWILEDVKPLPEPIPAKGKLGLWEWAETA